MTKIIENFVNSFYKITYIVGVPEDDGLKKYNNLLKIGDATLHATEQVDEQIRKILKTKPYVDFTDLPEIKNAAEKRVKEWIGTSNLPYEILFAAINIDKNNNLFRDHKIHNILKKSGYKKTQNNKQAKEWFEISLTDAIKCYEAAVNDKPFIINNNNIIEKNYKNSMQLRAEQQAAVNFIIKQLSKKPLKKELFNKVLLNCVMRFGKTFTTYEFIKQYNILQKNENNRIKKILIITHRPVTSSGWEKDFYKVFGYETEFQFAGKHPTIKKDFNEINQNNPYVYFASMQDIRGSFDEKNNLTKNQELFNTKFDLLIIDEAHEGTKTSLAEKALTTIQKTNVLMLTGTSNKIINDFETDEIFTFSYLDEMRYKKQFYINHPDQPNPYEDRVEFKINTIDVNETIHDENIAKNINEHGNIFFNLNNFFAVDKNSPKLITDNGISYYKFKNEKAIRKLLKKIFENDQAEDVQRQFPFSTDNSKENFAHTLWVLPNVESAISLKVLLNKIAPEFTVINATSDNAGDDSLKAVEEAIKKEKYTITLTVGQLTTGTTIPEWTAVFMMSNTESYDFYYQTISRVRSAGTMSNGKMKQYGYVFDFAPDRALKFVSTTVLKEAERQNPTNNPEKQAQLEKDIAQEIKNYMPVISMKNSQFREIDTEEILYKLEQVSIEKVQTSGFYDNKLFTTNVIINKKSTELFEKLSKTIGTYENNKQNNKTVSINESQITENEKEKHKELNKKEKENTLTKNEKTELAELEKKQKIEQENQRKIISILRSVAIRIPLIVFACSTEKITVDNFTTLVDEKSWEEFMPKGFTKNMWHEIKQFFNRKIFEGACYQIINKMKTNDTKKPIERIYGLIEIFATFKNPDKETVLTPAKVVDLQINNSFGGYSLLNINNQFHANDNKTYPQNDYQLSEYGTKTKTPQKTTNNTINNNIWTENSTIYEINSKTALYPLYCTMNLYKNYLETHNITEKDLTNEQQYEIWNNITKKQIFVNCRVPYSAKIAQRVLTRKQDENTTQINSSIIDITELFKKIEKKQITIQTNEKTKTRKITEQETQKIIGWILLGTKEKTDIFNKSIDKITQDKNNLLTQEIYDKEFIEEFFNKNIEKLEELFKKDEYNDNGVSFMNVQARLQLTENNINKALKKAEENNDKFTAVISNPPYQINVGGESNVGSAYSIWQDFIFVADKIADYASFINPGRWQKGGAGTGLLETREYMLNSGKLVSFITIDTKKVFNSIGLKGDICIETFDFKNVNKDRVIRQGVLDNNDNIVFNNFVKNDKIDIILNNPVDNIIVDKILSKNIGIGIDKYLYFAGISNKTKKKSKINDNSIKSGRVKNEVEYFIKESDKDPEKEYIKIYFNDGNKLGVRFLERNELVDNDKNNNDLKKWKVLMSRTDAHSIYRNMLFTAEPESLCANNWVCKNFNNKQEAENYITYIKTYFYRYLVFLRKTSHDAMASVHRFVPDLVNITNPRTGLVGYDSDWCDDDLRNVFAGVLDDSDWEHIVNTARDADGGRG